MSEFTVQGQHHILDIWDAPFGVLNDMPYLKKVLTEAIEVSGATILSIQEKKFEPQGCTLLFLLSESHLSIHTAPEFHYAGLDLFTCGQIQPEKSILFIKEIFQSAKINYVCLDRGMKEKIFERVTIQ